MLADKLGWRELELAVDGGEARDEPLLSELLALLQLTEIDMTLFFRGLARVPVDGPALASTGAPPLPRLRLNFCTGGPPNTDVYSSSVATRTTLGSAESAGPSSV